MDVQKDIVAAKANDTAHNDIFTNVSLTLELLLLSFLTKIFIFFSTITRVKMSKYQKIWNFSLPIHNNFNKDKKKILIIVTL